MIALLILALAVSAFPEDEGPPDPIRLQVQKCFQAPPAERLAACEKAVALPTDSATHAHLLITQAIWQEKERPGTALPLMRLAVQSEPGDVTSRLVLGWYLDRSGRPGEAREEYREVARLAEGDTENVDMNASVLTVLKESEADLGPFFLGIAQGFERISQPRMASAFYSAAILNWRDKSDYHRIVAMYETALKLSPESTALHVGFADFLREMDRASGRTIAQPSEELRAAAKHMAEAVRLTPADPRYRYEHARILVETGDLETAIAELREAIRLRPDYPDAESYLRIAVLAMGGPGLAVGPAGRPDSKEALEKLGDCVRLIGTRGRVACNDALKMGLSGRNAAKARFYLAEGLPGKHAAAEYAATIEADPLYALAYFRLGQRQSGMEAGLGERALAIGNLSKAAELKPQWVAAHELLALEWENAGRMAEATAELQKAVTLEPDDSTLYSRLRKLQTGATAQPWSLQVARPRVTYMRAGNPDSGTRVQDSGLLIALKDHGTFWIVRDNKGVRVQGPVKGIIVPRKTEWWRVAIASSLDLASPSGSSSLFQQIVAGPLQPNSSPPKLPQEAPCAGRDGEEHRLYDVEWINSEYAGISREYQIACAGEEPSSGRHLYVVSLDSLRKHKDNPEGMPLSDFGGEPALTAMREGMAIERMRVAAGFSGGDGTETISIEDDRWSMKRERGRWFLERPPENEDGVRYASFDIPFDAPARLAGQNEMELSWDTIQEAVPDALDAFTSPSQNLIVVLTASRMLAFDVARGALGECLLRIPLGDGAAPHAVMAQWARGGALEEWNRTLRPVFQNAASSNE